MSKQKWVRTDYDGADYITPGKWYKVDPPELFTAAQAAQKSRRAYSKGAGSGSGKNW